MFNKNPAVAEVAAAQKYGTSKPFSSITGWALGKLRKQPQDFALAVHAREPRQGHSKLERDVGGLSGGPIEMSATDRYGPGTHALYSWNAKTNAMEAKSEWLKKGSGRLQVISLRASVPWRRQWPSLQPPSKGLALRAYRGIHRNSHHPDLHLRVSLRGSPILYKAGRVANFTHGELGHCRRLCFLFQRRAGGRLIVARRLAVVFAVVMGTMIYVTMMRRVAVLRGHSDYGWHRHRSEIGDRGVARRTRHHRHRCAHSAGGATLSYMDIASVLVTIVFIGLYLFFTFTRLGVQFRGTAENPLLGQARRQRPISCYRRPG